MDATVQALAKHLEDGWEGLLKHVGGVEDDLLHWTPGPAFNSVAILLRHLAGSERYWIGEAIGGIPSGRVRDTEFAHDRPRREDVLRAVEDARRQTRQVLAPMSASDLQAETSPSATSGNPPHRPTKMWALLHYIDHLGYHRGQALLLLKLARSASRETAPR
jgi:uncharacterized damage-inducible protein DinB